MDLLDNMKAKALLLADTNSGYTEDDFDKEFGFGNHSPKLMIDDENWNKLNVLFTNKSNNQDPEYATNGSSGFDLRADITEPIIIEVGFRSIIPTGLYFELPDNFEIQIRPRSGLAAKNGITVLNSPGTIDADYRGEIKIILVNLGQEPFTINHGDRIAQAVIAQVTAKNYINLKKIDEISDNTERGSGGFGSTGIK